MQVASLGESSINNVNLPNPENSSCIVGSYIHQKEFTSIRIAILSSYLMHSSKRY